MGRVRVARNPTGAVGSAAPINDMATIHSCDFRGRRFAGTDSDCWTVAFSPAIRLCQPSETTTSLQELKAVEKCNQVCLLLGSKTYSEPLLIEGNYVTQTGRRTIVEVRRARRQSPQDRSFHFSNVGPQPGDQSASRISGLYRLAGSVVLQRDHRQIADVQRTREVPN